MGVLLAVYYLFLSKEKMHHFKRFYLLGSLVLSLCVPFINIPVYVEAVQQVQTETQAIVNMPNGTAGAEAFVTPLPDEPKIDYSPYLVVSAYLLVTLILGARFIANMARFYSLKKHNASQPYKDATLVLLDDPVQPHSFLGTIFLNRREHENGHIAAEVYTHELTHIKQRHTLDILFVEVLKTLFWFNPLLYLYKHAIQLNHEFLADEHTINQFRNIPTYQKMLLDKAMPYNNLVLASSINFNVTRQRFIMMTKTTTKTKGLILKLAVLPVIGGVIYALSTETVAQQVPVKGKAPVEAVASASLKDSTDYKKRRDAYYSGVKVLIDDQANNVYIDKPFEQLTEKDKGRYYFYVPDGYPMSYLSEAHYKKLQDKKGYYVEIDGNPVDNAELKNHSTEEFVYHNMITKARKSLTKERPQIFEYYLYTLPYYNKHFKNKELTHFPDTVYTVSILKEYKEDKVVAAAKPKKFSTVNAAMKYLNEKEAYNYTDVDKMPQYPGGIQKFKELIAGNFKKPASANQDISTYYLNVIISQGGTLVHARILNEDNAAATNEMVRVLKMSATWKPGIVKGKPVTTSYTLPVQIN
jgi:beta-lactamase regulating signal transducer with metallopeptidase domain